MCELRGSEFEYYECTQELTDGKLCFKVNLAWALSGTLMPVSDDRVPVDRVGQG